MVSRLMIFILNGLLTSVVLTKHQEIKQKEKIFIKTIISLSVIYYGIALLGNMRKVFYYYSFHLMVDPKLFLFPLVLLMFILLFKQRDKEFIYWMSKLYFIQILLSIFSMRFIGYLFSETTKVGYGLFSFLGSWLGVLMYAVFVCIMLKKDYYLSFSNIEQEIQKAMGWIVLAFVFMYFYYIELANYNGYVYGDYWSIMIIILGASSIFEYIVVKIDEINKNKLNYVELENKQKTNEQKLLMMSKLKEETEKIKHQSYYLLLKMEQHLKKKEYIEVEKLITEYKNKQFDHQFVSDTKNALFDLLLSMKVNELKGNNIDVKCMINISENTNYDDLEFINFLSKLIDCFKNCLNIFISLSEIDDFVLIKVLYANGSIDIEDIQAFLETNDGYQKTWNVENSEELGVRISIQL